MRYTGLMRCILLASVLIFAAGPAVAEDVVSSSDSVSIPVAKVLPQTPAEQRADRLDELFARLHRAKSSDAAQGPEHDIWALWMTSDSPTADALLAQATRAMNDGAYAPSRRILDRMVELYPAYAEAWNKRATLNFMENRLDDSLADIGHVLDLEPRHFGALSGKGLVLEKQKKYSEAIDALNEALAINPNMTAIKDAIKAIQRIERAI